ncbi:hypothetical protein RCXUPER_186 [Rhodobacter phage RcXuper]|nr:hypothetical protein RCXUPER_186 [Rhodobacter phage RcXuper]
MAGRYITFSGDNYYPFGGWSDMKGSASSIAAAKRLATGDWAQVVDVRERKVVAERHTVSDWKDFV